MMRKTIFYALLICQLYVVKAADLLVETESFADKGGWVLDQQFMDNMGSPYLLAHGLGSPVADANTLVKFESAGTYHVYARTYNWTSPWSVKTGPGAFQIKVNGKRLKRILGTTGDCWMWQYAGAVRIRKGHVRVALHDLRGFDGRCDAIYFTTDKSDFPPQAADELTLFRQARRSSQTVVHAQQFDFVVVGAGVAGICAAVSAARLGCKVALVHDRPVLGGNNSSEVRVHLGGAIDIGQYPELGGTLKEFGPDKEGNAQPASNYADEKKMEWVRAEKNITLYTNYHAIAVNKKGALIESVVAENIESGERVQFAAPLFCDCTGDASVGFLAGADYRMGREGRAEFNESAAPEYADSIVMGSSVQWYSAPSPSGKGKTNFPEFDYGMNFCDSTVELVNRGEWTWETGMHMNQISQAEQIRDYGMLVVYSNWSYIKNHMSLSEYDNLALSWVAYVMGKRESRRLMGDYILKQEDLEKRVWHEDASFTTSWSIDLHRPDDRNTMLFPNRQFKATTDHVLIHPYGVPYRCLYSRNVDNLFMAGRCISVTHVALGTVRVMRTTGMMGEVVGMAAAICRNRNIIPRQVYQHCLPELKALMNKGVNVKGLPNNQKYNEG